MNNRNKISVLLRLFLFAMTLLVSQTLSAQSNGDKLFIEGQTLQQIKTIASQNKAIKKFQAAKIVYTTTEKKKMCDNQISICRSNIAAFKSGKDKRTVSATEKTEQKNFLLSTSTVVADAKKGLYSVSVTAPSPDWNFNAEVTDGKNQEFVKSSRDKEGKSLILEVDDNNTTLMRTQNFVVVCGEDSIKLNFIQKGKPVVLKASTDLLEFKAKGGGKIVEIYTNSDSIISDNKDQAWYVQSKPDWLEISFDTKKQKSLFSKIFSSSQDGNDELAEDVKACSIAVVTHVLAKTDPSYLAGRRGEIVFASQDKTYKIIVLQQK